MEGKETQGMIQTVFVDWLGPNSLRPAEALKFDPPSQPGVYIYAIGGFPFYHPAYIGTAGRSRDRTLDKRIWEGIIQRTGGQHSLYSDEYFDGHRNPKDCVEYDGYSALKEFWNNPHQHFATVINNMRSYNFFWAVIADEEHRACIEAALIKEAKGNGEPLQNVDPGRTKCKELLIISRFPEGIQMSGIRTEIPWKLL